MKGVKVIRYSSLEAFAAMSVEPDPIPVHKAKIERRAEPKDPVIPPHVWEAELPQREPKQLITLRLDPDVIRWFRQTGKGYQSRMGAVLSSYVEAKRGRA